MANAPPLDPHTDADNETTEENPRPNENDEAAEEVEVPIASPDQEAGGGVGERVTKGIQYEVEQNVTEGVENGDDEDGRIEGVPSD